MAATKLHATKKRSSNVELLRIVAMLMIIIHHFSVHGPWPSGGGTGADLAVDFLSFGGKIACDIFVLITGYFMIKSRFRIRGVLRLVFETFFYSFIIFTVFVLATGGHGTESIAINWRCIQQALLPISSNEYWFVTTFVVMMFLIPAQNLLFAQLSNRARFTAAAIGFVAFSVLPTVLLQNTYTSNVVWFCYLYFVGGCIRSLRDNPELIASPPMKASWLNPAYIATKYPLATTVVSLALLFGSMPILTFLSVKIGFSVSTTWFIAQNTLPAFFAGLGLFALFSKMDIPYVGFINKCGASVFGVYLIHDNPIVRKLIWAPFEPVYAMGGFRIILVGLLVSLMVLSICIVIDILRIRFVETPFMAFLDGKIGAKLDAIDNRFDLKGNILNTGDRAHPTARGNAAKSGHHL